MLSNYQVFSCMVTRIETYLQAKFNRLLPRNPICKLQIVNTTFQNIPQSLKDTFQYFQYLSPSSALFEMEMFATFPMQVSSNLDARKD